MRSFPVEKRLTILVCLLQDLRYQVIDDLLEMVDALVGRTFTEAEKDRKDLLAKHGKALNLHLRRFRAVAQVLLDPSIGGSVTIRVKSATPLKSRSRTADTDHYRR